VVVVRHGEELCSPASRTGEEDVGEEEEQEEVYGDAWVLLVAVKNKGHNPLRDIPIWCSQTSEHSSAMSPSSSPFFACVFRLFDAMATFCSCVSAACVLLGLALPLGTAVVTAMLRLTCRLRGGSEEVCDGSMLSSAHSERRWRNYSSGMGSH
jgi:hypothetical protein